MSDNIKIYYNRENKSDMNNIMRVEQSILICHSYIIPSLIINSRKTKLERDDLLPYIESEKAENCIMPTM